MKNLKTAILYSVMLGLLFSSPLLAQEGDTSQSPERHIGGTITATNNGVSIIPSFSLGRPAVFFDLTMGGERLSFDPMIRFGMDGKPWSFVFWGRYKLIKDKRFTLTVGGHPAFLFQERDVIVDGKPSKEFVANRYVAGELNSKYQITDKFSLGLYFLHGSGLQRTGPQNSDFLALNIGLPEIVLVSDVSLMINPQIFFLSVDENSGYYLNSAFTFKKGDYPIQFQAFFNQKVNSTIAGDDLVWNLSLLYKFNSTFSKK
ncbi:hypothetical protein E4S40_09090 [Algoriphagus kandeliae]|uniref:DUF481 domain-containing protein n=1 Tax=Algoriphagus kandeliae TaxID=2562278 RepID=A0A4Y9QNF8_9BACT|nr:hypothetical protein [Algoriphagus kandeliae]TFV94184.1 hypothetical protein E4S40_09090 [Algoriphagus kandeliae]